MKFLNIQIRFSVLAAMIVLIIGFVTQMYFSRQERHDLEIRMREKATFINNFYAFLIADSLQRQDDVTLLQVINRLEEDQEVISVQVVDRDGEVRYDADSQKIATTTDDAMIKNALQSGDGIVSDVNTVGGRGLALVSPLKVQGQAQPIGAVRINMTFRHIENQVQASQMGFLRSLLGLLVAGIAFITVGVNMWVYYPLKQLKEAIAAINPLSLEANLPESGDDFGQIHSALNELILRLKAERQNQETELVNRTDQEYRLAVELARSLLPQGRVLIADKDNHVISDIQEGEPHSNGNPPHLMDLITDTNFATLLNTAFQQEGNVVQGPVRFQDKDYTAGIMSLSMGQSAVIKTLIALRPNEIK